MLHGDVFSPLNEKEMSAARYALIRLFLGKGRDVIVDATHLNPRRVSGLMTIANECGAEFETRRFEATIEESLERDARRIKPIGEDAVRRLHREWDRLKAGDEERSEREAPKRAGSGMLARREGFPTCVCCDLDGTLADHSGNRSPYDYSKVSGDKEHSDIVDLVRTLKNAGHEIIFVSGRDSSCRGDTMKWLNERFGDFPFGLFMRTEGDRRPDNVVKREIFETSIRPKWDVFLVLDDHDRVVKEWRDIGLRCLQVNYGNF
jgi:hypothetical protein